jgi:hypothetical protein
MATAAAGANPAPPKTAPIRENTPEKKELLDLFKEKNWPRFPTKPDADLEDLMKRHNWNRTQVSRHFGIWLRLGRDSNKSIDRSKNEIIASLKEKCDSAEVLLERTFKSPDIVALLGHVSFPKESLEKMKEIGMWSTFMDDIFETIAADHASSGKRIPHATAKYCLDKESKVQELWKKFGGVKEIRSFFYLVATEFVSLLQRSFAEPNVAEIEDAVVRDILKTKVSLPRSHAETLYFILGFVINAVEKEGIRRKSKGLPFKMFAKRHCMEKGWIEKARESGSLPMGKTDRVNEGGLHYPTSHFYQAMVYVERIYCALLTDDNLLAFGPTAIKRIHNIIEKNKAIRSRLAVGKESEGSDDVVDFALQTFGRVRGSDYAGKLLARSGRSYATATRTDLQVKSESKKKLKAKESTSLSQNVLPAAATDEVEDENSVLAECCSKLDELIETRVTDEDQLVRNEIDGDTSSDEEMIYSDDDDMETEEEPE